MLFPLLFTLLTLLSLLARPTSSTPTTGAPGLAPRLPLSTLHQHPQQWNLYLLSLISLQSTPEPSALSYYSLASIHGAPHTPFQSRPPAVPQNTGYCPHSSILFGAWHRPYLALYEQSLVSHATRIAARFRGSERARYIEAARTLRTPYWDWAADGATAWPVELSAETVQIRRPGAQRAETVPNPLRSYRFQTRYAGLPGRAEVRAAAVANSVSADATEREHGDIAALLSPLRREVWQMLQITNTTAFATSAGENNDDNDADAFSLEGTHNTLHNAAAGWMTSPELAAFDPLFWIHHATADRQLALWQALHPRAAPLVPRPAEQAVYNYPAGTVQSDETPLYPFRHAGGRWFTARDVDSVEKMWGLGYTYPELPARADATTLAAAARRAVDTMYRPRGLSVGGASGAAFRVASASADDGEGAGEGGNTTSTEWLLSLQISRAAVTQSFSVDVQLAGKRVASVSVLGGSAAGMRGAVVLTEALAGEDAQGRTGVAEYLEKELVVAAPRAVGGGGDVEGVTVRVRVSAAEVTRAEGEADVYGPWQVFGDVGEAVMARMEDGQ
ncbi:hypothetical protein EDC01DRAFT_667616 [Geopyxis carbonaria]|nr:hypothetical protein EDC01DRAFT_667616 [Geopyxis carbonaria]